MVTLACVLVNAVDGSDLKIRLEGRKRMIWKRTVGQ